MIFIDDFFGVLAELPNSGELEREDYLPLKLPPLPSIDSAVESWASGASRANDTPVYTAGESACIASVVIRQSNVTIERNMMSMSKMKINSKI